jgi:hypothetical protein
MENIKQMKNYKITKLFFALCFLLAFASCESNDDVLEVRVKVKDFSTVELTEDRMVFYRGESLYLGEYDEALIFEKN